MIDDAWLELAWDTVDTLKFIPHRAPPFCRGRTKHRRGDSAELALNSLGRAGERGDSFDRLGLVLGQRIGLEFRHPVGVAREILHLELQHMRVWRNVAR